MSDDTVVENPEEEEVLDEMISDETRRLRVYDPKGDFLIDIPAGAKVTFGYFNPAAPQQQKQGYDFGPNNVARQTALRIYEKGEKGNQLACFIGVTGFRDMSIALTKTKQRIVVERNFEDDGLGSAHWDGREKRELVQFVEDDTFS